ncbi:MAG: hypothetical protein K9N52_06770 [Verrucomicrobia bacterium]|nr:hypothetical protein [Verrucomicrobiota bacterium]
MRTLRLTCYFSYSGDEWYILDHSLDTDVLYFYYNGSYTVNGSKHINDLTTKEVKRIWGPYCDNNNIDVSDFNHYNSTNHVSIISIIPANFTAHWFAPNIAWFAFCSSDYLNNNNLIPFPDDIYGAGGQTGFGYKTKLKRYSDSLALPKEAEFFASRDLLDDAPFHYLASRGIRSEQNRSVALNPMPWVKKDTLCFTYQVTKATNINNISIPLKFKYRTISSKTGVPVRIGEGTVMSLYTTSNIPDILTDSNTYIINDHRFRHDTKLVDMIVYTNTGSNIPLTNSAMLHNIYKNKVASAPVDPLIISHYSKLLLYIITFLFPLYIGLRYLHSILIKPKPYKERK